jgi:hypothetical protein
MRPLSTIVLLALVALVAWGLPAPRATAAPPAQAGSEHDHGGQTGKVGQVSFPVSCNAAAQTEFTHGVAMLHSFWFAPARQAFAAAAEADPACGMAHWGIAMTWLDNPLGGAPPGNSLQNGAAAVEQALVVGAPTEREQLYIAAIAAFYQDHATLDYRSRALAYEKAMERLTLAYPDDREAAIFYALALNVTALPTDKTFANTLKAAGILERIFEEQPDHPGITHYLIHSYDYPATADQGVGAARRYAGIAPVVPHAQHMPSHIFTRVGAWQDSIDSNRGARAAAWDAGGQLAPGTAPVDALHPMDYLAYAHLQLAQDGQARTVLDDLRSLKQIPARLAEAYALAAIPARYALERGQWAEAAGLAPHLDGYAWDRFPQAEAATAFARGYGAARTGDAAAASQEAERLAGLREALVAQRQPYWVEVADIQRQIVLAWAARAEGRDAEALAELRAAADREDVTDKHPVTPGPLAPARELLGELLLELGSPSEALTAFEASQAKEPHRFRGYYGAARAAEQAGDAGRAMANYAALLDLASQADADRPELAQARAYLAQR